MVDKLLVALWHAEFQCRYGLYRTGLIMLADISMEFGLSQKGRRMVEDVMPQVNSRSDYRNFALRSPLDNSGWRSRAKSVCVPHVSAMHHHDRAQHWCVILAFQCSVPDHVGRKCPVPNFPA